MALILHLSPSSQHFNEPSPLVECSLFYLALAIKNNYKVASISTYNTDYSHHV